MSPDTVKYPVGGKIAPTEKLQPSAFTRALCPPTFLLYLFPNLGSNFTSSGRAPRPLRLRRRLGFRAPVLRHPALLSAGQATTRGTSTPLPGLRAPGGQELPSRRALATGTGPVHRKGSETAAE